MKKYKYKWEYIFWVLVIVAGIIIILKYKNREGLETNSSIPLKIFQTWNTHELPPKMKKCNNKLKKQNPEFSFYLYDDNDCRNFIKQNFNKEVLTAFDVLIPGAYKADLWRYCVLYKEGGIYIDIKYKCKNNFKLIELKKHDYFVKDRESKSIYNGFIVCKPNNPMFLQIIKKICDNCKKKEYSTDALCVTGPTLFYKFFTKKMLDKINLQYSADGMFIYDQKTNKTILEIYPEYRREQKLYSKKEHYGHLWNKRKIYNEITN